MRFESCPICFGCRNYNSALDECDECAKNYLDLIKNPHIKEFTEKSIEKYGTPDKILRAFKIGNYVEEKLKKSGIVLENQNNLVWTDLLLSAVMLHNLFYDGTLTSIFMAREKLTIIGYNSGLTPEELEPVFQSIEGQLGESMPVPACRVNPNSPSGKAAAFIGGIFIGFFVHLLTTAVKFVKNNFHRGYSTFRHQRVKSRKLNAGSSKRMDNNHEQIENTEKELTDFLRCPIYYDAIHINHLSSFETISMQNLLNKVAKMFYANLMNGNILSPARLKTQWDKLCKKNTLII